MKEPGNGGLWSVFVGAGSGPVWLQEAMRLVGHIAIYLDIVIPSTSMTEHLALQKGAQDLSRASEV